MIRHIVLFKFKDEITQKRRNEFAKELRRLADVIPEVLALRVGVDMGGKPNSFDLALDSTFATMEDVETYAVHPDHLAVIESVNQICADTVKVDYVSDQQ
jgi:hypothetical protein